MFGTKHLIIIAISLVLIIGLSIFARKIKFTTLCKILLVIGIISEFIKCFFFIINNEATYGGILPKTDLPFHLCSIQILFIAIVCFIKNEKLKRVILSFMLPSCLIGGFAAILIPTSSSLGSLVITFQYFIYHISIIVFALQIYLNKEIKLTIKDYFSALLILLVMMLFAIYINSILYDGNPNINFMYAASPPAQNLPFLTEKYGWLVYACHYMFTIFMGITLCYIKPIIHAIKQNLKARQSRRNK